MEPKESIKATIENCKQIIKSDPNNMDAHLLLGACYVSVGLYQESIEAFKQVIRIDPNNTSAHCGVGAAYDELGHYPEAIEAYKDAIRIDPDNANAYCLLGACYVSVGLYQESIEAFKQVIRIDPNNTSAHCGVGAAYDGLGRYPEAIEAYKDAIRIDPDNSNAYCGVGAAYDGLGHYEKAIQAYRRAIKINPNHASAHFNLGIAYDNLGRYEEAIKTYKRAIWAYEQDKQINPNYPAAYYNLGLAYDELGHYEEAIHAYSQAIEIKPDFAEAHFNLGLAYTQLGYYAEAIEAYKDAIREKPDYGDAYYNLGVNYGKLKRYKEAIESLKQAVKINPNDIEAHGNLGFSYALVGDRESALEEYEILKNLDQGQANRLFEDISIVDKMSSERQNPVQELEDLIKYYSGLIDQHRAWLRPFGQQRVEKWEDLLKSNPEGAICESLTRKMLSEHGVKVEPYEDLSSGGPDFKCTKHNKCFYVETTCISIKAATRESGLYPTSSPDVDDSSYWNMTEKFRSEITLKIEQFTKVNAPRIVVIGTLHPKVSDCCIDELAAEQLLTSPTKITHDINSSYEPIGNTYETTGLEHSAFIRFIKDSSGKIEFARTSISAVLLCGFGSIPPNVVGCLHPNPNYPFDRTLLPQIEFCKLAEGYQTGQLKVEWI